MTDETFQSEMKGKIDSKSVHDQFEMTPYEEAYYFCRPTFFAFSAKYLLCFLVLGVHLLFWYGNTFDAPDGENTSGFLKGLFWLVDLFGMWGFVFTMLVITWFNRFMNWSSSGAWYTTSLFVVTLTPLAFVIENVIVWVAGIFGSEYGGVLPTWDDFWYLLLGVAYFAVLFSLTTWYGRSFRYGISNRAVYLKKDFMLTHTMHNITLLDIDNLKLSQPWYGRILGFGTVNILTGSGFGVRERTASTSVGVVSEAVASATDEIGLFRKFFRAMIFMVSLQRTREEMNTSEPEDCLYGIRTPSKVYKLINELKEKIRVSSTDNRHEHGGAGAEVAAVEPVAAAVESTPESESDPWGDLQADLDLE